MYDVKKFSKALASIDIPRSRFGLRSHHATTFNCGQLIPVVHYSVLPGDTFDMNCKAVVRLSSPLKTPIFDDIYLDIYWFFVANRLVWDHWPNFMFENTETKWKSTTEYTIPQVTSPEGGWNVGTLAEKFGVRPGVSNLSINALPFRCYCLIYNEWFRDQNLIDPTYFIKGDSSIAGSNGNIDVSDPAKGGMPLKVSRFHDYFSSALPAPQKSSDVILPLGSNAFVYAGDNELPISLYQKYMSSDGINANVPLMRSSNISGSDYLNFGGPISVGSDAKVNTSGSVSSSAYPQIFTNLYADLSSATATTINQLRQAFQLQKFFERLALGGSRYTETIRAFFNVVSSDARLQRPEFLGGDRCPLNINQVVNNTGTDIGNVAGYSLTVTTKNGFVKSFEEHGYIIGVACVRHSHTYQQGMEKDWFKIHFTDYFFPVFNNIGEQPIYNREIFTQGTTSDSEVFGYQEPFADYKYKSSYVSGEFRSDYTTPLDTWHLADDYSTMPVLGKDWIEEGTAEIDRVLKVQSSVQNQFIADFGFDCKVSRCMSMNSVPGLIDHH